MSSGVLGVTWRCLGAMEMPWEVPWKVGRCIGVCLGGALGCLLGRYLGGTLDVPWWGLGLIGVGARPLYTNGGLYTLYTLMRGKGANTYYLGRTLDAHRNHDISRGDVVQRGDFLISFQ